MKDTFAVIVGIPVAAILLYIIVRIVSSAMFKSWFEEKTKYTKEVSNGSKENRQE
ncbi:MAG: hypothetical protein ACXABY_37175 [Candidatus Thorarchaeota archaeon]|jgi:hypothetical protein